MNYGFHTSHGLFFQRDEQDNVIVSKVKLKHIMMDREGAAVHALSRDNPNPTVHRSITVCGKWTCYGGNTGWIETDKPLSCKKCVKWAPADKQ